MTFYNKCNCSCFIISV